MLGARTDPFAPVLRALERPAGGSSDFDLNPETDLPGRRKLRSASVLVPIILKNGALRVILTKRSSALRNHPGQIAFPGGKVDETDCDAAAAALREAREEIGLDPANVDLLGKMPCHETVTGFSVTPFLGRIREGFRPMPEPGEVDEIFAVPLAQVTDMERFSVQSRRWRSQRRHYYAVPFGPYYIWGATARILRGLAERMEP